MAFDTQNQRRSALNSAIYRNLPIASGTITIGARAMMLFQYAHDSFPSPPAVILDLFQPQIKSLKQKYTIISEKQEGQVEWVQ
jgi:hypothetical protein